MRFTNKELAECAEREVKQRRQVYPRLVEDDKMSQEFADHEIAKMERIAIIFRELAIQEDAEGDLFGDLK